MLTKKELPIGFITYIEGYTGKIKDDESSDSVAHWAYWYARDIIEGRWIEGEKFIIKNFEVLNSYISYILNITDASSKEIVKTLLINTYK